MDCWYYHWFPSYITTYEKGGYNMFEERDKFTQYLEDIVQDFYLKNLGEKPDLPWGAM